MHEITRYHDISCGHRVAGHESKCSYLHGHNYRFVFALQSNYAGLKNGVELDRVGRVVDFSVVKDTLCAWLESNWDHRFLIWEEDPFYLTLRDTEDLTLLTSVVRVPFNPTAENIAEYIVETVAPQVLAEYGVYVSACTVWETRKCSATYRIDGEK
jgi:6-pyruvoyltetrahydropterin/6-carboxytetrahydropterin synthase